MPLNEVWLRPMQIAKDIIIAWPTTVASIPGGWVRETSLDGRFVKQIATSSTAPGATGGSTTHLHTFSAHSSHTYSTHNHSGSWGDSGTGSALDAQQAGASSAAYGFHTHSSSSTTASAISTSNNTSPTNFDTTVLDPLHVTIVFIKSDGSAVGVPVNGVMWYNGAAPSGFSAYSNLDNRLMKGAATGADGGTQAGTDAVNHTHTSATHTHPVGGTHLHAMALDFTAGSLSDGTFATSGADPGHSHTLSNSPTASNPANSDAQSETTGNGDSTASWNKVRAVQKTGGASISTGVIGMWLNSLASIPTRWKLCDGTGGTPNLSQGNYVRAAASDGEVGNTGGAATHTHAASAGHNHTSTGNHSHSQADTSGGSPGGLNKGGSPSTAFALPGHVHSATFTSSSVTIGTTTTNATTQSANTSNDPTFTGVAYLQLTSVY